MDKQQFTVGGSQALLEAFIKDSGYPACNESTIKYPYIGPETVAGEQALYGTFDPDDLNYTLPEQYTEALEAVKNYFKKKEDGFKEGDYVTCIDDSTDFDLAYGRAEWRERAKIRKGDVLQVEKVRDNEIMFDGIWQTKQAFRPSTKEEIARKDSIYVAGYEMQIIEDKTGRKKAKFCDQFFTLEMLQAYRHLAWMSKYTSVSINVGGTELSWDLLNKITIKLA